MTSNQLQSLEARVPILADDDVVVHRNPERLRHFDDRLRHLDVGAGRRWISGRVIVHETTMWTNGLSALDFRSLML